MKKRLVWIGAALSLGLFAAATWAFINPNFAIAEMQDYVARKTGRLRANLHTQGRQVLLGRTNAYPVRESPGLLDELRDSPPEVVHILGHYV